MKHYVIAYDNSLAAEGLKKLLVKQVDIMVHTVQSAAEIRPLLLVFDVSIVFIGVGIWDYRVFKGMKKIPLLVMLCNPREKMKEELLGKGLEQIPYLKEPITAKDVILLNIKLSKLVPVQTSHFFFVKFDRRWRKVLFEDIFMIEKRDAMNSLIHTRIGNLLVISSVRKLLVKLPSNEFIRVADGLVLPCEEASKVSGDLYTFQGREIKLSFRFSSKARAEKGKQKTINHPNPV